MSYSTRLIQAAVIAAVGLVAFALVLVASALAEENTPPTAVDDIAATVQDTPVVIDVLANDSDEDGGTLIVAPGALARAAIVAANPLLFWECYPAGGGTVLDRSVNGNNGSLSGAVSSGDLDGDCDGDNAFLFPAGEGSSVVGNAPTLPQGDAPRTFIVRFQAGLELAGGVGIFGVGTHEVGLGQFSVSRDWDNGQLILTVFGGDAYLPLPGGSNLGDGAEHTIAVTYDGAGTATAYLDGVPGTPVVVGPLETTGTTVMLGSAPWTASNADDQLRQFAAFDSVLDGGTIATIHAAISSAAANQAVTQPANGTVTNNRTSVTYTPNPGFFGVDTFTYSVSDGQGGTASATVTVHVSGLAGAQPDNVTTTTGNSLVFNAVANDLIPDGLTAEITDVTAPANGTAVILDATTLEYAPNPGFIGTDSFFYTLTTEPGGETSQAIVTITVTPANDAPVALDDVASTTMSKPVHIQVLDNDSDPDGHSVYISPGQLGRGAILRAGPLLHWECLPEGGTSVLLDTSGNGRDGAIGAGVSAGTETGDCDNGTSMTFGGEGGIVTLDNPGLPQGNAARAALVRYKANFATEPADIPLFGYGQNGTPFAQFTVSRTVLGNDKLIFTSWANDLHFDLPPGANIADGNEHNIMFVYDGNVTVYAYFDGIPSGQGTLHVPLETIDDTVMLGGSPWGWRSNGDEMRQFAIFPTAISEADAYLVHAAIEAAVQRKSFTDPRHGTVIEDADHLGFTYIPDPGYVGPDQFYYSISDGHGGGSMALVTIEVLPGVNALNDTATTPADTPVTIDVLANDTAQPGAVLTVTSVTQPAFGTVTTDGATVTFTPQAGWLGIATFTYTAESDLGGEDSATVAVNVGGSGDNFPPLAVDDVATTPFNTPVTINVLANDSDPDNDGIAISRGDSAIPGIRGYDPALYWACLPAAGASTLHDQSGNGVSGTINGAVTPGALVDDCGGGTTMIFPNAGAYVGRTFPGLPAGSSPRTVVLRYRTDISDPSTIGMFGYGTNAAGNQQFSVSRNLTGNDTLSFTAWGNDTVVQLPVSIADGLEHTIAIVYDGGTTITGYVDGVAGVPASIYAPLDTVDSEVILGRTLWGAVGDAAEMRHFAVFDRALSGGEIADIHDIIESVIHDPAFTQPSNGTVSQVAFDSLQYAPNAGFSGVDTFQYYVADGNGGESIATVTVTVEAATLLDLEPADDTATAVGTTPVTIDVLANDSADPTATLTIVAVTQPANGTVTTDGATVQYTAHEDFEGDDTFTYTVEDGLGNEATATVTVTVEPEPNVPPVAGNDFATTTRNTPVLINVLANDSDPDGDPITLAVPTTAIGTLNSFAPSLYWACLPESGVTVPDQSGNGNDGTIQGNVLAGPVASDCGGSVPVFADGSALIFNSAPGSVPVGNEARTLVVRFRSDLTTPSDVGLFGYGTNAVGLGQFSVARTSAGNDRLVYATWGGDGTLMLPPGSDIADGNEHTIAVVYDGANTLTAYLDGVAGPSATVPVLNTVNGQVMLGQTLYGAVSAGAEMRHFAIYAGALDAAAVAGIHQAIETGGSVAFTQPANGVVSLVGEELLYAPDEDFSGEDTFTYFITDGRGGEASATVTVTVLGNQAPVPADDLATTSQGQPVTIDVLANDSDPENDTLSFIPSINALSTLNAMSPALYWACLPESGSTVPDQSGNGNDGTIQGNVLAGPVAGDCGGATPVFADGSALIFNNLPNTLPLGADPRTIVVRYRSTLAAPANIGLFGYGKNAEPLGQFSIARTAAGNDRLLIASWGGDNILHLPPGTDIADGNEHTIAITYDGANSVRAWIDGVPGAVAIIPQLNTLNDTAMLGQTLYGAVSAGAQMRHFAIYNGVLTADQIEEIHQAIAAGGATAWTAPSNGSVSQAGDTLVYTPNRGFVGTDSFTYTVQDEEGLTASATVTVTVEAVALEPQDDAAFTQQETPVTIPVLDNDAGADLQVEGVSDGANGTVTTDGTTVTYTPAPGFFGTDSFTVEVSDGIDTVVTTVTVTVNARPTGPNQTVATDAGEPVTVGIIPPVSDPDGDDLEISSAGPASNGSVVVDGTSVVYTPNDGFDGEDSFEVTVTDSRGGAVVVTVTVLVDGNQPPVALDDVATTNSPLPVTIDVLANDSDPEGNAISFASAVTQINAFAPSLYWACLPESGVTVPDQSGNGNDGTIQGNVLAGPIAGDCGGATPIFADGSALIFNSTPGSVPVGSAARTIIVRFRSDLAEPANVGLFGYGTNAIGLGQFSVARTSAGNDRLVYATWGGDGTMMLPPGSDIADGNEHTIAVVYDGGSTLTTYLDGVAGPSATVPVLNTVNGQVMLGQTLYGAVSAGAEMRHFAIYDGSLTPASIAAIHAAIEAGGALSFTQGANGTVTRAGDQLVYTPNAGFVGTDSFTYTISDGKAQASATVTVEVLPPLLEVEDDVAFTQQDTPTTVAVLDNDEGDNLEVVSVTQGANGAVTTDGTTVTYAPNPGFWGTDTFTVEVSNGTATETSTVTVIVNGAPQGGDLQDETLPETPVTIAVVPPVTDPEGTDLTITSAGPASNGTVEVDGGNVVYTPAPGFTGTDSFEVTIVDEDGGSLTITVTVEVNTPLIANDDTAFTQQGTPVTVAVLDNDEGDHLVIVGTSQGANGSVSHDGTTVTYTPDPGFWGTDTFTVVVQDGDEIASSTVTVTVNGTPQGSDLQHETLPETPVTIAIVPPVTDPEGTDLTLTSAGPASNGTVEVDGGNVVYTPAPGFTGTDSFEVTIVDEDGGSLTITVTVLVHVALVANDDTAFTQQGTPVTVAVLDNDEGDALSVVSTGVAANGTVTTDGTNVTYTPNPGFWGTDTFTVVVRDAVGGEPNASSTVTVTVNGTPTGPDIDAGVIDLDTSVTVGIVPPVTDPEGGELTITSAGPASNGSVTIDGDAVVYTPNAGFSGLETFQVTITDEDGGTLTITVTVLVNAPPAAVDVALSTQQGVGVGFDSASSVTDPDGDDVTIASISAPANGTVTTVDTSITYTPDAGFFGVDTFEVTVQDQYGAQATFTVTVTVNGAPTGDDIATTTSEDVAVDIDVLAVVSDPDGDDLEVTNVSNPANGTVSVLNGVVTYAPAAGFVGTDSFEVTVEDGEGGSATITVTVTVIGAQRIVLASNACVVAEVQPNGGAAYTSNFWLEAPGTPASLGINSWQFGSQAILGYFEAGTELVLSIHVTDTGHVFMTGPAHRNPDNFVHALVTAGTGNVLFTVEFEDLLNGGDQDFNDAVVDLLAVDCEMTAVNDTATTPAGAAVEVDVLANDSTENGTLQVAAVTQGAHGSVTTDGSTVTYTPNAGFVGTDTFTYTAENGLGRSATATVTVTVTANACTAHTILAGQFTPAGTVTTQVVGSNLVVTYWGGDGWQFMETHLWVGTNLSNLPKNPSGNAVPGQFPHKSGSLGGVAMWSVTIPLSALNASVGDEVFAAAHASMRQVAPNGTVLRSESGWVEGPRIKTPGNWAMYFSFTLQECEVDEPLQANDDSAFTQQGEPVTVAVLGNDVGNNLSVQSTGQGANGSVTTDGTTVMYTPNPGFAGTDSFSVTVTNGTATSTSTTTVFVNAPPSATDVALVTIEGVGVGFATGSVVIEPDGDDVTIVDLGAPSNGTATTDGSSITYHPDAGFSGADSFVVTVQDSYGAQATFTVTVTVNGAPEGDDIATTTSEDVAVDIDVLAGISDPEGDALAIVGVSSPAHGTVTVDGGTVTYTPNAGYVGIDAFNVTVEDEPGNSVTISVSVTVVAAPRIVLTADACLAVVALGGTASYTSNFWLEAPGTPTSLGISNKSAVGTTIPLGTFAAGTEVVLAIHVADTGHVFMTGPAWRNPDNLVHVALTPGAGGVLYTVGFEDLLNGGDLDFDDAVLDLVALDCGVTAEDDAATTSEDAGVEIPVLLNDSTAAGSLAVIEVSSPGNGAVSVADGVLTYTPNVGFSGTDSFTYTVENGFGGTATATVTVTVQAAPRVILSETACIAVKVEQHGVVAYTNQFWLEAPGAPQYLGVDNWAVGQQVALGTFEAGTELVLSIHVTNTGHVFKTGPAHRNPDNLVHAHVTPGTGNVLYTVGFEDLLNGGDLDFDDAIVSVLAIDCGVDAGDDTATTSEEAAVQIPVLLNDSTEAGTLAITEVSSPGNGSVSVADGVLTYTPNAGFSGTDSFTYTVENGLGGTSTATVTVAVQAAPRVILSQTACIAVKVEQHGGVVYTNQFWLEAPGAPRYLGIDNWDLGQQVALGTFEAGTELVLSIHVTNTGHVFKTGPGHRNPDNLVHAHVTPGTGNVLYLVKFEDLLNGGDQDFNDAIVSVRSIDCGVDAVDDTATTKSGQSVDINVRANDSSAHGTLVVTAAGPASNGTVEVRPDGRVRYTPTAGFVGTATFAYTVSNGLGGTDTATVTVTVTAAGITKGKMTDGGTYQTGSGSNRRVYNWGFELRCSTGGGHFSFHDEYNRLHVNNVTFTSMLCTDEPGYSNGKTFDTVRFTAKANSAQYGNNHIAVTLEATLTDRGSNGSNDTITIVVRRADNGQILSQLNNVKLTGGNHTAHNNN